jgi:hypothetical protein
LSNIWTNRSGHFQNFEFKFLAGIVSNTWQAKIGEIEFTVRITVAVRLVPVAMLVETSVVEPSPLCPDPSRATWEEMEDTAQTPPLFSFFLSTSSRPP